VSHYPSGGADCDSIVRDVLSDYGSCSDQCVLANRHARMIVVPRADRRMTLSQGSGRSFHSPCDLGWLCHL